MADLIVILTNAPTKEEALQIASASVERHLAAAVNIVGPMTSVYRWEGKIETAEEWQCLIKTGRDLYEKVEQVIQEFHSYQLPGILALPISAGSQHYLNWIEQEMLLHATEAGTQEEGMSKEELLRELAEAHEKLIGAATTASQRGVTCHGDEWEPREIVAHVAGWEAMAVSRIPQIAAGIPPIQYVSDAQHAAMDDAINSTALTMIGDQSFEAVCDILRKTYQHDIEILSQIDALSFRPGNYVHDRTKAAIDHCYEHAKSLENRN